jgi:hypothetical protein
MVIQHFAKCEMGDNWASLPLAEFEALMAAQSGSQRDAET